MVGVLEDDNVDMRDRDRRTPLQPPIEYDERLMYPSNKVSVGGSQLLNQNSSSLLPRESTMENAGLGKSLSFAILSRFTSLSSCFIEFSNSYGLQTTSYNNVYHPRQNTKGP